MTRTRLLWGLLIAVMAGVMVNSAMGSFGHPSFEQTAPRDLPILGTIPGFTLVDETGRTFESARRLAGRVWIADFIFTSCAGQCPQMTQGMGSLQRRLPREIQLVSVSVDPARDTPAVLSRYGQAHGADPARWHFLTGEPLAIERLAKESFHLSVAQGETAQEPVTHSVRFVLVDQEARIRASCDGTDPKAMERLIADAKFLVKR